MTSKKTKTIGLVGIDEGFRAELKSLLQAAQVSVKLKEGAEGDLIVVDQRHLDAGTLQLLLERRAGDLVLLVSHEDKDNINLLLARYPVCHLIGHNGKSVVREVATTAIKQFTGQIWGLAPYFDASAVVEAREIKGAEQINDTIDELLKQLDLQGTFAATHEYLQLTANELSTNAVYNAPVDDAKKPKYEQTDRKIKIRLLDNETVRIAVCQDATSIGISVEDKFGRLDREKIVRHLVKCVNNTQFIDNKKGGAGAGIYLAFYTASQFIINVDPGKRLEVICILEKTKRYKEHQQRVTSFNFFSKLGGAA